MFSVQLPRSKAQCINREKWRWFREPNNKPTNALGIYKTPAEAIWAGVQKPKKPLILIKPIWGGDIFLWPANGSEGQLLVWSRG